MGHLTCYKRDTSIRTYHLEKDIILDHNATLGDGKRSIIIPFYRLKALLASGYMTTAHGTAGRGF